MLLSEEEYRLPDGAEEEDEEDTGVEEETIEDDDEEIARAENGEVCDTCGAEFTEANGKPTLCQECHDTAEDKGVTEHPPLSQYPVK